MANKVDYTDWPFQKVQRSGATYTMLLKDVWDRCRGDIGLDTYPIWDEAYRETLNRKILDTFWYREIAHETIDIWLWRLHVKMETIMPAYCDMARKYAEIMGVTVEEMTTVLVGESESATNARSESSHSGETAASSEGNTFQSGQTKSKTVASEYPQMQIQGRQDYASNSTQAASETSSDGGNTQKSDGSETAHDESDQASSQAASQTQRNPSLLLDQHIKVMEQVLNIDQMILDDLEPLFMGVWAINDSYTNADRNALQMGYATPLYPSVWYARMVGRF